MEGFLSLVGTLIPVLWNRAEGKHAPYSSLFRVTEYEESPRDDVFHAMGSILEELLVRLRCGGGLKSETRKRDPAPLTINIPHTLLHP